MGLGVDKCQVIMLDEAWHVTDNNKVGMLQPDLCLVS